MSQDFYAFLTHLGISPVDGAWVGTRLLKVEVSPRQVLWRFHIQYEERPISKSLLDYTTELLGNQLEYLHNLELIIHPSSVEPILLQVLDKHKSQLTALLPSGIAPEQLHWTIEDKRLDLHAADFDVYQQLMEGQVCNLLSSWLWDYYCLRVVVRVRPLETVGKENDGPVYIPRREVISLLPGYSGGPAKKKGSGFKRSSQAMLTSGSVVPFKELEDGLRAVVVEGEVWDKKVNLRRDGRFLVLYYLTDGQDSLIIKAFYDQSKEDQIENGDYIRACGNVNYDPNLHEIAMLLDAWIKQPRTVRDDLEPVKRVELHAHTKMSSMDALCEVHELVKKAARWGHKALAITDHGCTQAFPDAYKAARSHKIKLLYGVEGYLIEEDKRERPHHIVLLARNVVGLQNMYRLVSQSYLSHYYRFPKIPRSLLQEHREGLLIGSACEAGELFQALLKGADEAEVEKIASFYDYLEIQPLSNNEFLLREGRLGSRQELEALVVKIISLGRKLGKPVVATGDVHFLEPEHEVYRRIIQSGQGYDDAQAQAPLYLKTTAEMLEEFSFLNEDDRKAVVVDNTQLIADLIEDIKPVPDGFYPPKIDRAEEEISSLAWDRVAQLYGSNLPEIIEARVRKELDSIIRHGFSVLYLIAQKLVKKSNDDGYIVGSRGSVGSSLIAYLTGITEVNPLPPHYICPQCKWTAFTQDGKDCGADLPDASCQQCGNDVLKVGFDIPFETFLGFEGDKIPDIDLNFSGEYQARAHQYVEELFGKENVFRAGTISTVAERTAYGFVVRYAEDKNMQLKNSEINRLVKGIAGVRRTTGQHPGGLIVVPRDHDIHEFTPLQHPAENKDSGVITTHFEYHAIGDQLVKLDILGHDDPTVIKALEDLTGIKTSGISLSEPKTMQLFSSVEPLGLTPEEAGSQVGTIGVPEFGTRFVRQILESTRPTTFSELVRICGLSHGTDVWLNNAQSLIEQEIAPLNQVICNRDDIMTYLIQKGLEKKQAFKIMEQVRKGKGLSGNEIESMEACSVPSWYIDSCQKIKYMFPKAHAVAYVINSFRIAYFKVYHPLAFYASFFTVRAEDFEAETVLKGHEAIRQRIKEIDKMGNEAPQKERKLLPILEVAAEMCARGFHFYPVDIYLSRAAKYLIKEQGLLIPFSALPNIGRSAAEGVEKAQKAGAFLSVEDFQIRTHLNKTSMDVLRQYQCFEGLPESNQIQLFA
ncbi:MAG: PolC-type DNA polymerase III [Syntrophomonas sp.]